MANSVITNTVSACFFGAGRAAGPSQVKKLLITSLFIKIDILTGLILHRSYAGNHSYYEFVCGMVLSCPGDTALHQFSSTSGSSNLSPASSQ